MSNTPAVALPTADLMAVIERAARDSSIDIDKMQRLLDMHEIQLLRVTERAFNAALVLAQAEMGPIEADAHNPQTRSKYATHAALDRDIRPIYTRHGLAPSFNTEPTGDPNTILVVGILTHREGYAKRYQVPMPIDTKGARGGDVMTRTHATGSALTYGKRYLLIAMFNLAIDDDDDGNGGHRAKVRPVARDLPPIQQPRQAADERFDPDTGEVQGHVDPFTIEINHGTWAQFLEQFLEPLQHHILQAQSIDEIDRWLLLNQDLLLKLKEAKPQLFRLFEKNIEPRKLELTSQ